MGEFTVEAIRDFLFFHGINFGMFSQTVRIVFAVLYVIIMILAAVLNSTILYVFVTKRKLRKPSNLVLSPLLWNSMLLLLIILPLTLLKICCKPVRTNRDTIAVQSYFTFFYIWLNFCTVMMIALNRARIIRKNSFRINQRYSWIDIALIITAPVWSALAPFLMFLIYKELGREGVVIYTFSEFSFMSVTAAVSYVIIIRKVKKSNHEMRSFYQSSESLHQHKKRFHSLKHTINLIIGGYLLTITPFLCACIIDVYDLYNEDFMQKHQLFNNIFHAVSEMILLLSSIINPFIYFYTQTDIREEIEKLGFVRRVSTAMQSFRESTSDD